MIEVGRRIETEGDTGRVVAILETEQDLRDHGFAPRELPCYLVAWESGVRTPMSADEIEEG